MSLDPDHLQALFAAALERTDPQARAAFLDQTCGTDAALRELLEGMLQSHAEISGEIPSPAGESIARHVELQTRSDDAAVPPASVRRTPTPWDNSAQETQTDSGCVPRAGVLGFLTASEKPGTLGRLAHYEVRGLLGKGGYGTVLKAFDEKLHRVVAIKVLAPELAANDAAKSRFLREARAAAAVRHLHVVDIHAVGEEPLPYLVMEYVEGQTLSAKIARHGPLQVAEILRLGHQIACGLGAAHKKGLIHRDIKPANILLEVGGENVKITDFGLARAADDPTFTQSGAVLGTPAYMSPEQAEGHALDQRSDLFSLGTVLYVMCTGRPPFRASSTVAVLKRVVEQTPIPIRDINPAIPQWLVDVIAKLQAKKPEDRYQSAQDVAELMARFLADQGQAGSVSDWSDAAKAPVAYAPGSPRRRRWVAAAALVGIALVFIVATQSQWLRDWLGQGTGKRRVAPQPPIPVPNWEQLFSGGDLAGWRPMGHNGWTVKDGVLIGTGKSGSPGWLMTEREFADFELQLEFKLSDRTDSGVFLRAWPEGTLYGDDFVEVQLLDDRHFTNLPADRKHGALFKQAAPAAPLTPVLEAWQQLKLRAVGNHVELWLEGTKIIDHAVAEMRRTGHIGLQLFPSRVEFRNIRVREMVETQERGGAS